MRCGAVISTGCWLAALLCLPCRGEEPTPEPPATFAALEHPVSANRIDVLKKELVRAATLHHPVTGAGALQRAVETGYVRTEKTPFSPIRAPISEESCRAAAAATAQRTADAKFPPLNQDDLAKQAEAIYPIIPIGQVVTVNYRINPVRISSITGPFKGKMGQAAVIGNHKIQFQDMLPPPPREKLVIQFDQQAALAKRRDHIEKILQEYDKTKAGFLAGETNRVYATELAAAATANEQAGYVWLATRWEMPRTLVKRMIGANLAKLKGVYERAHPRTAEPKAVVQVTKPREPIDATPVVDPDILVVLTTDPQEEEDASSLKTGEESPVAANAAAALPQTGSPEAKPLHGRGPKPTAAPSPAVTVDEPNLLKWATVAVFSLIVVGSGIWLFLTVKPRKKSGSRYYETKDAAEHGFWAKVETSGGTMPHVAYSFSDYAAAFEAMAQLSFVEEATPNRPIVSSDSLDLGTYMLEHNFIAFVGGEKMTYAMWHETVATFRGTEKTTVYRCSETPKPNLTLPDPATIPGCESKVVLERAYDGEGDDFSHYVVYTAPDRKTAEVFLKNVKVNETAVQVIVQTPEGHWGKDSKGNYKE